MANATTWFLFVLSIFIIEIQAAAVRQTRNSSNVQLLNNILSYVNESSSACEDYYQYACGKYGELHRDDLYTEITGQIDHTVNNDFVSLMAELEQRSQNDDFNRTSVEAKVLGFFQTCRQAADSTRSEKYYLELVPPAENLTWPQFANSSRSWPAEKFNWMETLARLRRYGMSNVLIQVEVLPDLLDSTKYMISIDSPSFQENTDRLKGVLSTKRLLHRLGVSNGKTLILTRKIKELESKVRDMAEVEGQPNDDLSVRQLERQNGGNWSTYLEILLGHSISPNFKVQFTNVDYFVSLMSLLNSWDSEVVASYLMTRFVLYLNEDRMDSRAEISCIQDVRRHMELATNLLYEQRIYDPAKLQLNNNEVMQLFNQLRMQFLKQVQQNRLRLNPLQRKMISQKLQNMQVNIGNMPQHVDHLRFVSEYYRDMDLSQTHLNYDLSHLTLLEFRTRHWFKQLARPSLGSQYFFYLGDSNSGVSSTPYYLLRQNLIIVPFGILQEPIFRADSHDIFKVSLLGFLLAHELMHAFVAGGLLYDAVGSASETGANILDTRHYGASLDCMNRNETDYLDERAADIAGIRLAYDAYFGSGSRYSQEQPNFLGKMTLKQLFFLNFAQFFCGDAMFTEFQYHDSDELRLRQTLINFSPFAEAHGCHQDQDAMHPANKCRLW